MEASWVALLVGGAGAFLLPSRVLLVWGIPALMVLSAAGVLGPVPSIGEADIQVFDFVLLGVALKTAVRIMLARSQLHVEPVYRTIVAFLSTLLAATLAAYFRFGSEVFVGEIVAFLRLVAQASVVFLTAQAVRTQVHVARAERYLDYAGYLVLATIYLNIWLIQIGKPLGEVQVQESVIRYFGPLGDQVGFLLIYFVYKQLLLRNFLRAWLFGTAIILTGTRGALISLVIGLLVLAWHRRHYFGRGPARLILVVLGFFAALSVAVWFDLGGMLSRLLEGEVLKGGVMQRWLTASIALRVFADNVLTGVGFTGFRYVALDYGAVELAIKELGGFAPNFVVTTGNQFLQVLTDGGIIALAIFIWMVVASGRTLQRAEVRASGEQGTSFAAGYLWLLSLAVGNQTAAWILPGSLISYLLWVLLGLAVAVNQNRQLSGRMALTEAVAGAALDRAKRNPRNVNPDH
ncbi:hypothetical protein HRbin11_01422 [bacterium HR11]|nr:hypothetical protein HRbin11_01422 [bacterium HR11]